MPMPSATVYSDANGYGSPIKRTLNQLRKVVQRGKISGQVSNCRLCVMEEFGAFSLELQASTTPKT